MSQERVVESALGTVATKSMGGGALTSTFGFILSNEMLLLTGIVVTIAGFIVNYFVRTREDRRNAEKWELERMHACAEEERRKEIHEATMARLVDEVTCEDAD